MKEKKINIILIIGAILNIILIISLLVVTNIKEKREIAKTYTDEYKLVENKTKDQTTENDTDLYEEESEEDQLVPENSYNAFNFSNIDDETMIKKYFYDYKDKCIYDADAAYELLDKDYREARFGSIESFKQYVNKNIDTIRKSTLIKYQINKSGNNRVYVCIDNYNVYYNFKETAVMQYTATYGKYDFNKNDFLKKYNKYNNRVRAELCIDHFINRINNKEYEWAYQFVDDGMKATSFKTLDDFENYMKNALFADNNIKFLEHTEDNNIVTYNIQIKSNEEKEDRVIEANFTVKLADNMNFKMSFSIGEKQEEQ